MDDVTASSGRLGNLRRDDPPFRQHRAPEVWRSAQGMLELYKVAVVYKRERP